MSTATTSLVEPFEAVCADPYATARAAAEAGRKVAGYMCTYTPEELLNAAGYLPVRILGYSDSTQRADGLLQAYACSLARAALDLALSAQLDFLSLMVFPHTCDTIQNLADIWRRNISGARNITLATPVNTDSEHGVRFYQSELARVRERLEKWCGPVSDEAIAASIALYNEHRAAMRRLYAVRRANPGVLSARDFLDVVLSSFFMPREEHLGLSKELLAALESEPAAPVEGPKVFVAGAACQSVDYIAAIEEAGCVVVDDELCTGSRAFAVEEQSCDDPLEALARMYLSRRPCAAKHRPGHSFGRDILARAREAEADGVIFLFTKFCDPWAFDYPDMRDVFEQAGVPSLLVEIEQHVAPPAQFHTRVAAFAEMVDASPGGAGKETAS